MNDNSKSDPWSNYFQFRDVSHLRYSDHRVAKYVIAQLPRERDARIVDLGCGYGQNLLSIKKMGYTNCLGVEPSVDAGMKATNNGLNIFRGTLNDYASLEPKDARLVLMSHVLEHIPKDQIIAALTRIRISILGPDGVLLVAVPNASSPTHCYWRYEDWTHTCLFTAGSLLYVLRAAGYSSIEILDPDCLMETRRFIRPVKKNALRCYKLWLKALCRVTSATFHEGSPLVLSFEVKALAKK